MTEGSGTYQSYTNDELALRHVEIKEDRKTLKRELGMVEMVIHQRLEASGAKELPSATHEIVHTPKVEYDQVEMLRVREFLDKAILDDAFVDEHDEIVKVEARFDMKKARHWGKYGKDVQDIIDAAKHEKPGKIEVKPRK